MLRNRFIENMETGITDFQMVAYTSLAKEREGKPAWWIDFRIPFDVSVNNLYLNLYLEYARQVLFVFLKAL